MVIIIFLLVFLATACTSSDNANSGSKIVSPVNNLIPIAGTWKVQYLKIPKETNSNKIEANKWLNSTANFSPSSAVLGADYCKDPIYKVKVVNTNSYLLYGYNQNPDYLNLNQKEIQIISISSENNFFYEFIKVNDSFMITNVNGVFLYLKKTSDSNAKNPDSLSLPAAKGIISADLNSPSSKSILLIGLRSTSKSTSLGNDTLSKNYNYRTLLISYTNKKLNPVLETKNLFIPRLTGFWSLDIDRLTDNFNSIDSINAFPFGTTQKITTKHSFAINERKVINFIGNDYVSIEKTSQTSTHEPSNPTFGFYLQVLPLDNINSKEPIKISQLTDSAGDAALKEGATNYLNSIKNTFIFSKNFSQYNWGVSRRNGHWVLKGRLTAFTNNSLLISPDFYIPIPAPKKSLIGYDDLYPTWSNIKDRVPDAIDAFSSPSKDILITISNTILSVYELKSNNIALLPLAQVKFKENETVIMNQWAQGDYTETWTKAFNKNVVTEPIMVK